MFHTSYSVVRLEGEDWGGDSGLATQVGQELGFVSSPAAAGLTDKSVASSEDQGKEIDLSSSLIPGSSPPKSWGNQVTHLSPNSLPGLLGKECLVGLAQDG